MPSLSPHIDQVPGSGIRRVFEIALELDDVIMLAVGEPDLPVAAHILAAGARATTDDFTNYTANGGIAPLRAAIVEKLARENDIHVPVEQVWVTVGATQALHQAMALMLAAGDEILVPDPGYTTFTMSARLLGGQPVRGVLLIDSPILGGWRAAALSVAKRAQLVGSISPGAISRKRKHQWLGRDEVLAHFRSKKAFARWDEQVLLDYIEHGTHDAQGEGDNQRLLSFDRDVETAIYNTLPHNLEALLKRHPLKCPVAFIGGRQSAEMKQVGMAMTEKVTKGRIMMLDGSHLFPMEKPLATAAAVEAALLNMSS